MSLVISITCAVLATLLQQWARRYLKVTQTRFSLHKRARIRTFFAEGVEKSFLLQVVEALPTLIHVSLVLFFAGLAVFLWNVNLTIFKLVLSWISVCTALYGCTMLISIIRRDSPYYTPLTPLALAVIFVIGLAPSVAGLCYGLLLYRTRCFGGQLDRFGHAVHKLFDFLKMTFMAPEKVALQSPPELDTRALLWTFGRLDEDHELARFFSGLPAFQTSKVVKDPLGDLDSEQKLVILTAMIGFLDRTYSSDLLPDRVKRQRVDICEKAIDLLDTSDAYQRIILGLACATLLDEPVMGPAQSTEIVQFVRRWGNRKRKYMPFTEAIFSIALARVQQRDDFWFVLASDALGIPQAVLRSHARSGDSLSLVILIHIIRQQFIYFRTPYWFVVHFLHALESASKFNVQDTSPELQHEFCALWNQIVRKAQNDDDLSQNLPWSTLHPIRGIYIKLHQGTDSAPARFCTTYDSNGLPQEDPSLYPVCNVPSHILDESTPTTFPRTVQHYGDGLSTAPLPLPDAPSLSAPAPPHIDENPAVPTLDNSDWHLTHYTFDSLPISLSTPDPANANTSEDSIISGSATPYPSAGVSTSARPGSSTYPLTAFSLQDEEDLRTPSDSLSFTLPASDPVLDDTLLIGPSQSSRPPITRSGQSPSFPGSYPSIIVTSAPSASLVSTSGPDSGTSAEGDGSPIPYLRQENDAPSYILDESAPTTFPRAVQCHDDATFTASLPPDATFLSAPAPPHVDQYLAALPPPDNSHTTHHTADSLTIPLITPDLANASATVTSAIATPFPTPGASTPARPRSSTSPHGAFSLEDKADLLTPPDLPNLSSTSSDPILDDTILIGPSQSPRLPITRSDQSLFFPESHPSIIVASAPSASLVLTSEPDPGTPADDDGGPIPDLRKENGASGPPSVHYAIDANTIPTPDHPPQSSSPPSVTGSDVAIPGGSPQEPNAGQTGDRPPYSSLYQYDMV
jgi:hypothetical protein